MHGALAYGEPADEIMRVLARCPRRVTDSGMHQIELEIPATGEAGPVVRAMMRAEAQLLIEDADSFSAYEECRTPEQRGADAFMAVVDAAASALAALRDHRRNPRERNTDRPGHPS